MRIKNVKDIFKMTCREGKKQPVTIFLQGKPGVGKSQIVKQFADSMDMAFIDLRLSQLDSVDVRGIPRANYDKGVSQWYPPEFLPFKGIEGTPERGILFLDELNRCRSDVMQSIFQLILDRRVGSHELKDGWFIMSAGNYGFEDGTDVIELDSALRNRLMKIDVEVNIDDWVEWAETIGKIDKRIINFLKEYPRFLHTEIDSSESKIFLTGRSWEQFNTYVKNNPEMKITEITNMVGVGLLHTAFGKFYDYISQIPDVTAENIIDDFENYEDILETMERAKFVSLNNELEFYIGEFMNDKEKITKKALTNIHSYCKFLSDEIKHSFFRSMAKKNNTYIFMSMYLESFKDDENAVYKALELV